MSKEKLQINTDPSEDSGESNEINGAKSELRDTATGVESLLEMPSFEDHLQDVEANKPAEFNNKPYKGRVGDLKKIASRKKSIEDKIHAYRDLGQKIPAELTEEMEFLQSERSRIISMKREASEDSRFFSSLEADLLWQKTNGATVDERGNPIEESIEDCSIAREIIDFFPYDYIEVMSEDSLESQRRWAVFERRLEKKRQDQLNAAYQALGENINTLDDQTEKEVFSPRAEDVLEYLFPIMKGLDWEKISGFKEQIAENFEAGCTEFAAYLSEALDITIPPEIEFIPPDKGTIAAGRYIEVYNLIEVCQLEEKKVEQFMGTIAHEMWHAHQFDVINFDRVEEPYADRKELYLINVNNYVSAGQDLEKYYQQLFELEAFIFGDAVQFRVQRDQGSTKVSQERSL